ncbi:hypothetical protein [Chryseobacterium gregarium]|uniref:hypothetical protein n=1 Tax=Chryseobacterium gregarium TaxID=456299 RepID=UPI000416A939|nr:hypothetical protein [Chryseobacterium gregarium]
MKKLFILILGFFFAQSFGQGLDITVGKRPYVKADLLMENGQTKHGYLKDFLIPKFVESGIANSFKRVESLYHYDTKIFKFKSNQDEDAQEIPLTEIKSIIIVDEDDSDTTRFDKMKLKTINSKYEIEDLDLTVMLPLQSEGKINLYGFSVLLFMGRSYYSSFFFPYIKKPNEEYAYVVLDYDNMGLFNSGKIKGKFKKAFEAVTSDCTMYQPHLNSAVEKLMDKKMMKESNKERFDKKKEAKKSIKDKEMELQILQKIDNDYNIKPYIDLIEEYGSLCP